MGREDIVTEAYVVLPDIKYDHKKRTPSENATLIRKEVRIPGIRENEVHVKVLVAGLEGNMGHAVERHPIDICHDRKEDWCILGNAGVVQVLETGKDVRSLKEGDTCIVFCNGIPDQYGYPKKIYAYDQPGSYGLLARETKLREDQLIKIPEKSNLTSEQWAAFSLRGITAFANWRVALQVYRAQIQEEERPRLHVGAWGGGVSLLEAQLAASYGHNAFMISSSKKRIEAIASLGITPIDRRKDFPHLDYTTYVQARDKKDQKAMDEYEESRKGFKKRMAELTNGEGVDIFIDYIGEPVFPATLDSMARQGVITTAGWKEGMRLTQIRAIECIQRIQRVQTHYARRKEGEVAVELALEGRMTPPVYEEDMYTFDTIPDMFKTFLGETGFSEKGYYTPKEFVFFPVAKFT